ncbi:MAG TPA: hypothetical protein VJA21_26595 [Verrucomicrobiae bacterium]
MRLSKLSLVAALAVGSLLVCTNVSSAQDSNQGKKKGGFNPEQRVERLATDLNLNADQKAKVLELFKADSKKYQELRADTSTPREQQREKMRTIREESDKKLKAILKPDQWEKYQKDREQFRPKGGEKKGERKGQKKDQ